MVIVVQAPTCTRSPSWSGIGTKGWMGSSPPLTVVPFVEFWSTTAQLPSGCWTRTACWCETPGSSGGTERSMSGVSPVESPAAADRHLVAGERALLLRGVRGQVQARGLGAGALHHRHEVLAVGADRRGPGQRLPLLLVGGTGAGRGLGRAGLRIAVAADLTRARAAGRTARRRGDHPVVVTAAEGRAPGLRAAGPRRALLRERGRGGLLREGLRGARTTVTARTARTTGRGPGRRRNRTRGVAAEAARTARTARTGRIAAVARGVLPVWRNRFRGAVHL